MGFYGNLTNTARTQFQFDRIYPNRYSMESSIQSDGVYIGRYVLIEYDADIKESNIKIAYLSGNSFFTTINHTKNYVLTTYVSVPNNEVTPENFTEYYIEENGFHKPASGYSNTAVYYKIDIGDATAAVELNEIVQTRDLLGNLTGQFWKCVGSETNGYARFEEITETTENNYITNYNIDITYYGPRQPEGAYSRAWDSTVWQKIYAEGEVKYIMIAELNTAAPSFSISFDAPTQTPLAPHVDASSGNNVYRVHLQPSWGFRIKEAENNELNKPIDSDLKVYHINSIFDSKTGQINEFKKEVNGSIYWNNDGFKIEKSNHSENSENYIMISPTGKSGLEYNKHKGFVKTQDETYQLNKKYYRYSEGYNDYLEINTVNSIGAVIEGDAYEIVDIENYDINEFQLHLPVIGDAVANFYDLMYDVNKDDRNLRYRDTEWKYYSGYGQDGPINELGGMTRNLKTLAGSINYLHDLEGMIIYNLDDYPSFEEIQSLSSDLIYCIKTNNTVRGADRYLYRKKTYSLNPRDINYIYVKITNEEYIPNCYFTLNKNATFDEEQLGKDLNQNNYQSNKDYYKRLLNGEIYTEIGQLTNYQQGSFYYILGTDYIADYNLDFNRDRQYYSTNIQDNRWREVSLNEPLDYYRNYYFNLRNLNFSIQSNVDLYHRYGDRMEVPLGWFDTTDEVFQEGKEYYALWGRDYERYYDYTAGDPIPLNIRIVELVSRLNYGSMTVRDIAIPADLRDAGVPIITESGLNFKTAYRPDEFYYLEQTGTVQPQSNGPIYPVYDYKLDHNEIFTQDRIYSPQTPAQLNSDVKFYYPNAYFYFENDDGENNPFDINAEGNTANSANNLAILDNADYPTFDRHYWNIILSEPTWIYRADTREWIYIQTILGWSRVYNLRSVTDQWIVYNEQTTLNELSPERPNFRYFYKINADDDVYHMIHTNNRNTVCSNTSYTFYEFFINNNDWNDLTTFSNTDFYIGGRYYYFTENDDIILDKSSSYTNGRNYFYFSVGPDGILEAMHPVKFYEQDYYYYKVGNDYVLDTGANAPRDRIYYEKDVYRVISDLLGIYAEGSPWNTKATMVPCTVTLGVAEPIYDLHDIGEVSSGTNSINNLILKYNQLLDEGEMISRSTNSIQGTLNLYKDLASRIDAELEPNRIMTTDYYGHMTTTDYSIKDLLNRISQLEARIQALES